MTNPKILRKRLRDFLLAETGNKVAIDVARGKIKEGRLDCTPLQYIADHPDYIQKQTFEIIEVQVENIVPDSFFVYLLKQFGVIAFLFVPAIYSLTEYALLLYRQEVVDIARLAACLVSILFTSSLLIGFVVSFFKSQK